MSKKELHQKKVQAKIDEFEARLAGARAKLAGASADAQLEIQGEIERVEEGLSAAKGHLEELANSADDAWEEAAASLEALASNIGARIDEMVSKKR